MARYLVERTYPEGLVVSEGEAGRKVVASIIACNSDRGVTWLMSYVSTDRTKSFCVYDGPSPEAVRLTALSNGLPVDRITEISVLDPYAYHLLPEVEKDPDIGNSPDVTSGVATYLGVKA